MHLERVGGVAALGFPNLASYAQQALGRSGRWAADVRALARRLQGLERLRSTLMRGELSTSMVELVARVATADDELGWIERARDMTVRDMRAELKRRRLETIDDQQPARVTVTAKVDRLEAWAFEHAKMMLQTVGARRGDGVIEAMLGEGLSEIIARHPDVDLPAPLMEDFEHEAAGYRAELAAVREDIEAAGDAAIPKHPLDEVPCTVTIEWPHERGAIDARLREAAADLARRDLELAMWGEWARSGLVWQVTGYRSFDHYCRDRIGVSPASMASRLALRRSLFELPQIALALKDGRVGFEAARAIARVAGAKTVEGWIERAGQRTVKQLREESDAVALIARAEGADVRTMPPPDDDTLSDVREVERAVIATVTGQPVARCALADETSASDGELDRQVTLRIAMSAELGRFWRLMEHVYAGLDEDGSWVAFVVRAVSRSWTHALPARVAYRDVYLRDRWQCASPVCSSRTTTPHHIRFRAHGGGEERANIVSLCETCHLELVHGGRLRVTGSAPDALRWQALGWSA